MLISVLNILVEYVACSYIALKFYQAEYIELTVIILPQRKHCLPTVFFKPTHSKVLQCNNKQKIP